MERGSGQPAEAPLSLSSFFQEIKVNPIHIDMEQICAITQPAHLTFVMKGMKEAAAITERAGALPITILNQIWGTEHGTIILKPSPDLY